MIQFLKPTKVTWWVFGVFISIVILYLEIILRIFTFFLCDNCTFGSKIIDYAVIAFYFVGFIVMNTPFRFDLYDIVESFGRTWELIILLAIDIVIYYFVASIISKIWYAFKNKKVNEASEAIS